MTLFSKQSFRIAALVTLSAVFCSCGSSDKIVTDILDDIEPSHQAKVSYVNAIDESTTFYKKSTVYPRSVYDNDHRVIGLLRGQASDEMVHEWINDAEQTEFAIEDTNAASTRIKTTLDLQDNQRYWSLAWMDGQDFKLSLFKKRTANEDGKYKVRLFANAALYVLLNQQQNQVADTRVGEVSNAFSVSGCNDLVVGQHQIDLCQSADFGKSYLVVINDQTGDVIITQE